MFQLRMIEAMIDFSSVWLWVNIVLIISHLVVVKLFHFVSFGSRDPIEIILWSTLIYLFMGAEFVIFVLTIRSCPIFDFGFNASILGPTVSFYFLLPLSITSIFKTLKNSVFSYRGAFNFKFSLAYLTFYHAIISLAYSSPTGLFLSAIYLFVNFILLITWPSSIPKSKYE